MAKIYSYDEALNAMKRLCSGQEKCHQDIRFNLIKKGIYGLDLENIITVLIEENYLNEERYAKAFVRGKFKNNNWGRIKILQGLKQKDISEYCIKKGLEELDEDLYFNKIESIVRKKWLKIKAAYDFERKGKLVQFLMSKGFESALSWEAVNQFSKRKEDKEAN